MNNQLNNIPGFVAEISVYKTNGSYRVVKNQNYNSVRGVIAQVRIGGGGISSGVGSLGGIWGCVACVALCTIVVGDGDACLDACVNSGACG